METTTEAPKEAALLVPSKASMTATSSPKSARTRQLKSFDATVPPASLKTGKGGNNNEENVLEDDTMSETESQHSRDHQSLSRGTVEEEEKCEERTIDDASSIDRALLESATEAVIVEVIQEDFDEDQTTAIATKVVGSPALDAGDGAPANPAGLPYSVEQVHDLYRLVLETAPDENGAVDPAKWEPVRSYLLSSHDLTVRAARIRNPGGLTPFHQACRHQPPMDVIELFISCVGLFILQATDNNAKLPLHHACAANASAEFISALVELYPESKVHQDTTGATPLHVAVANADLDPMVLPIVCSEAAACITDRHSMLPLHYAVIFKKFSKPAVVKLLIETYPQGLTTEDLKGRVPIRWFAKSCNLDDSLELLEFSFAMDPSLGKGDMGLLLLSHLEECAKKNGRSENIQKFLDLLVEHNFPDDRTETYSKALKKLPRWLNKTGSKVKSKSLRKLFRSKK